MQANSNADLEKQLQDCRAELAELARVVQRERTRRQQAEEALHQREQLFRALAENAPDLIARLDKQLRHLYVNTALEAVTGLSPQDFIGKTNRELGMPEALCTYWEENFQQVFTTGQTRTIEFDFLTPDGTTKYYQSRIVPEFARDGSVEALLVVACDVTEFKQTEKALQENQQLLQAILDAAPTRIYLKDLQGRYILVNRCCWEDSLGLSQEQIIGKTDYDIWSQDIADTFRASDQAALEAGIPLQWEQTAVEPNGLKTFITTKFPLYDAAGTPYAVGGISSDITDRKQIETALRESEERFRQLAENIDVAFWMRSLDEQHNKQGFLYISPGYEKIWGRTRESLYEQPENWLDAVHPDDLPRLIALIERQRQGEYPERVYRIVLPDGSIRWIQDRTFPIHDSEGRLYRIAGIVEDITKRKQAEVALQESEERFRQLAENIDAVFWMFCLDEQKSLYISPAYEKIWGRSPQSLYENPENWLDTIYPEDRAYVSTMYERQIRGEQIEDVYRIVKPDGSVSWIHDRAFPVYDSQGRLYRTAGIAENITERKLTEAALKASEQKYRNLVETSQGVIWSVNTQGRLTFVNQAVRQIYGYEPEEMIGLHFSEFVTPEQAQKDREIIEPILTDESVVQYEAECLRKDGTTFWVSCNAMRLCDDNGNVLGTTGTSIDISDRKRAEEQLKASLQEKEALLKEVHHRVKNNLQVISSLLDLQAQQIQEPIALEAFQASQNRIKSIALIHEKLYQSENLARVNLADYIYTLTTYLLQTYPINPNNITLQLKVVEIFLDLDKVIPCGLIINELVSNALKHGFPGDTKGTVWIEFNPTNLESHQENTHQFTLVVGNDGIKLQDSRNFYTAKTLGFQLVNILVKQLGGQIEIDQSRGTEFKIRFSDLNRSNPI